MASGGADISKVNIKLKFKIIKTNFDAQQRFMFSASHMTKFEVWILNICCFFDFFFQLLRTMENKVLLTKDFLDQLEICLNQSNVSFYSYPTFL